MDVLSDVLRMVRLEGAMFLNAEFFAPWCVDVPRAADLAAMLMPGAENLVICHYLLEGECWVQQRGGAPVPMRTGDVLMLPLGEAHVLQRAEAGGRRFRPCRAGAAVGAEAAAVWGQG